MFIARVVAMKNPSSLWEQNIISLLKELWKKLGRLSHKYFVPNGASELRASLATARSARL